MQIRQMTTDDTPAVSRLCLAAFGKAVAPELSAEGIETFTKIASADSFAQRMSGDNRMLVCTENEEIRGVIELKESRHVAMLFIDPAHQRRGIGRRLIDAALQHAQADVVTVSASLFSVPAYQAYGFTCSAAVAESAGLVYQPMEKIRPA